LRAQVAQILYEEHIIGSFASSKQFSSKCKIDDTFRGLFIKKKKKSAALASIPQCSVINNEIYV
jgi:hypothetical protein